MKVKVESHDQGGANLVFDKPIKWGNQETTNLFLNWENIERILALGIPVDMKENPRQW